MSTTKIEWAEKVWNPITGCTKISAGCDHCYAERMAKRLAGRYGYRKDDPFGITFHADRLHLPLYWKKPSRIFVNSMGDLFHKNVPILWTKAVYNLPLDGIHWIIAGGETGPGARRTQLKWLRSVRDKCQNSGVPFFKGQGTSLREKSNPHYRTLDHTIHQDIPTAWQEA